MMVRLKVEGGGNRTSHNGEREGGRGKVEGGEGLTRGDVLASVRSGRRDGEG